MDVTLKLLIETLGIVSFAITGMIVAQNKGVSPLGIFLVALVAGLGGGTVRDILLDTRPFYWEKYQYYIPLIFVVTVLYVFSPGVHTFFSHPKGVGRSIIEALAVASLGVTGANKAAELGQPWLMIAIYGVISAGVGGVLRDVIVNEFPLLLKPGVFLAEALFVGCFVFAGFTLFGMNLNLDAILGMFIIFGIRMFAMVRDLRKQTTSLPSSKA